MPPRVALLGLSVVLAVSACSSSTPGRVVTVTVNPSTSSSASSRPAAPSLTRHPPNRLTRLPGPCDTRLTDYLVAHAIGGRQPSGRDAFVVGAADATIGRVGYLNCRYGVTGTGAGEKAKVEIGVSLYRTAAQAAGRIPATVDDYTAHGATAADVTVAGATGKLLTGGAGAGYALPLLVVASGQRTVAVTLDPTVTSGATLNRDATALAVLALQRTGG